MAISMCFGIVQFPGSNCDQDCLHILRHVFDQEAFYLWHKDHDLKQADCIILPGGFSYGDSLRCGAIARFAPIMREVQRFAEGGGLVLGICNGFQILLEAGLLPGALLNNASLKFRCEPVRIRVEQTSGPFTCEAHANQILQIPIAHGQANYSAALQTLAEINRHRQERFRYCDEKGQITDAANPNGSAENIAGITNRQGNVLGMMPHPERASESVLGSADGKIIFESILSRLKQKRSCAA